MPISHGINDRAKRPSAITKEISSDTEQPFSIVNLAEYIVNMGEIRNNYQQALIYILLCRRQTVLALQRFDPNNIVDYQRVTSHLTLRI